MSRFSWLLLLLLAGLLPQGDRQLHAQAADESTYYAVEHFRVPEGTRLEVGGLDFLPDGRLVLGTRRGQVWILENPLAENINDARFTLYCEGLQEILGVNIVDGKIHVLQRSELSRLEDRDNNGRADTVVTVCDEWGVSGNYHEFAFGLPRDNNGDFWISLNVAFFSPKWWHGKSPVQDRGWIMKVGQDGQMVRVAPGVRSPCGLGRNRAGDIFVTDNQGDWVPVCSVAHVVPGRFYGHPAGLDWTAENLAKGFKASDTDPVADRRAPVALWIPYDWSRSTGNLVEDESGGRFGPFSGQMFLAEMTNGLVLRASLEKVRGEYQGATYMFRRNTGSAIRVAFSPDGGTLFCGLSNRGWGGQRPDDGLSRIRYRGTEPMEILEARVKNGGFVVSFTRPLDADMNPGPKDIELRQYDYDWWWEYGSPERHNRSVEVSTVRISDDRRSIELDAPGLRAGMMARCRLKNFRGGGLPLLHDEFAYTLNQFPDGPLCPDPIAKLVPPPAPRESGDEGWLFLHHGDALAAWEGSGWEAGHFGLNPAKTALEKKPFKPESPANEPPKDPNRETPRPKFIANTQGAEASLLRSKFDFGDIRVSTRFMLSPGGRAAIRLMGNYEIILSDTPRDAAPGPETCGALAAGRSGLFPGKAPMFSAYRGPGEWHEMTIFFSAPVFGASGAKTSNAIVRRILIDDTLVQENVELPEVSLGTAGERESSRGPIVLSGGASISGFGKLMVRALNVPADDEGWTHIFNSTNLDGWKISDNGTWTVENGQIVGSGGVSHLFSPRDDYRNFEFKARCRISDGGNSGMYFRVAYGPGWPSGYEAQVNSTNKDKVKTGSLYGHVLINTALVPEDTWFVQHIRCEDRDDGTHITIRVNDVEISRFVDPQRQFTSGHIAFQQHHPESVVRYRDVVIRELE